MPMIAWHQLCDDHKCDKCGGKIESYEAPFTSVKSRNTTNTLRVICSECVMEALDEKTTPDIKDSDTKIQAGKQVSSQPTVIHIRADKQASTVH
jgi:hypothetical protein